MQTTIEQKVAEISIDQKLAALKEISDQKDDVDSMLSRFNTMILSGIHTVGFISDTEKFYYHRVSENTVKKMVTMIEDHLKTRRVELISHAEQLMR